MATALVQQDPLPTFHQARLKLILHERRHNHQAAHESSVDATALLAAQHLDDEPGFSLSPKSSVNTKAGFSRGNNRKYQGLRRKVLVGHSIYKEKAALTVEPRPTEFAPLESGAFKLAWEGYIMLQFAPRVRQYDWSQKQVFALSVSEIGTLVSLGSKESCEFIHDPNKGNRYEGKVRKVLKVEPLVDGNGYFF